MQTATTHLPIRFEPPLLPPKPDFGILFPDGIEGIENPDTGIIQEQKPGHYERLSSFVEQANEGFRSILSKPRGYDNVLACFTTWKDHENPAIIKSATALRELLRDQYGYKTEEIVLPSTDGAARRFNNAISQCIDDISDAPDAQGNPGNNLFILYYGGHAGIRKKDMKGIWFNREVVDFKSVEWEKVEYSVSLASCDLLFILDCCFSGGILKRDTPWLRRCEFLGASGPREKAGGGQDNFTDAVRRVLGDAVDHPKSAAQLYWHLSDKANCGHLVASPRWDMYTTSEVLKTSIRLHPLNRDGGASSRVSPTGNSSPARTLTANEVDNVILDAEAATDAHVLVAIRFTDPEEAPVLAEWLDWARNRPQNIGAMELQLLDKAKFHLMFPSGSALAVVSMPLWMWSCVGPRMRSSCKFIDIIRSDVNLLEPYMSSGTLLADPVAHTGPLATAAPASKDKGKENLQPSPRTKSTSPALPLLEIRAPTRDDSKLRHDTSWNPLWNLFGAMPPPVADNGIKSKVAMTSVLPTKPGAPTVTSFTVRTRVNNEARLINHVERRLNKHGVNQKLINSKFPGTGVRVGSAY